MKQVLSFILFCSSLSGYSQKNSFEAGFLLGHHFVSDKDKIGAGIDPLIGLDIQYNISNKGALGLQFTKSFFDYQLDNASDGFVNLLYKMSFVKHSKFIVKTGLGLGMVNEVRVPLSFKSGNIQRRYLGFPLNLEVSNKIKNNLYIGVFGNASFFISDPVRSAIGVQVKHIWSK